MLLVLLPPEHPRLVPSAWPVGPRPRPSDVRTPDEGQGPVARMGGTRPARSLSRRTPSCIPSLPGWRSSCGAFSPQSGYAGSPPDLRPIQVLRKGLVTGSLLRKACAPIAPISSTASTPSGGSTLPILISNEQSTSYSQSLFNRHFYYNTRAFIYNSRLRPLYHT